MSDIVERMHGEYTSEAQRMFTYVTVHEKTRYIIGHFGENEALTELISMQTAE